MGVIMTMRNLIILCFVFAGCTVPTEYSKSVIVKKDANGKIFEVIETEAVLQRGGLGYPLTFEHLKGVTPSRGTGGGPDEY